MAKTKSKKEDKLSMCMITQAYYPKYWSADKWDADVIKDVKLREITDKIAEYLKAEGAEVDAVYGITHDRDTYEIWDDKLKRNVIEEKHLHGHWVVKFKDKESGLPLTKIAEAVGLAPQYVEKAKPGRFAFDNMLAYLIHAKDSEKFAYSASDVVQYVENDAQTYQEIYAERKSAWERGRAKKTADKARSSETVDDLYLKVINGEITEEQIQLTWEYYQIYAQNIVKFEKGFEAYRNRRIAIAVDRMNRGDLKTKIIYIQGASRSGKSTYAKKLAQAFVEFAAKKGERWRWGSGAAYNPVEQFDGQEVFIMNDLREGSMKVEDWLRLLDPNNAEVIYGRYKSRPFCPEYLIITCHLDVYDFFNAIRNQSKHHEPMDQFIGRLSGKMVVVTHDDVRLQPMIEYSGDKFLSRDNRPVDYNDGYGAEKLRFGFTDKYLQLPNSNDDEKMIKLAEFLMSEGDIMELIERHGIEVEEEK